MHALALSIVLATTLLSSCVTTVSVKHLVPSEVDLTAYRTIAVASTEPFGFATGNRTAYWVGGSGGGRFVLSTGYSDGLGDSAADIATRYLTDTLANTDYFTIIGPETTDAYLTVGKAGEDAAGMLKARGAKALLTSAVTYMDLDETIYSEDVSEWVKQPDPEDDTATVTREKLVERKYFLKQTGTITFTFSLLDLESRQVIVSRSFTAKDSAKTYLGSRLFANETGLVSDRIAYSLGYAPTLLPLFDRMLASFQQEIGTMLAPSWETTSLRLMPNKPKNGQAKEAYKLVESGSIGPAYRLFEDVWESTGHIPSGYNAALLLEAQGDLHGALELMATVCDAGGDSDCYVQLDRMEEALALQKEARQQISGKDEDNDSIVTTTQTIITE
jgi:hypothetical protein